MSYSLQSINKLLQQIEERNQKYQNKINNKKKGYSPRCSICNDPKLDEIEKLREENYTLQEIKDELELDYSIMSLSRHFQNHYPKSQAYKQKQQLQLLENIREAYIKYPFLEEYFKDKELEYLERFNMECGFCTDKFSLCDLIPENTVSNSTNTIKQLRRDEREEIENRQSGYYSFDKEIKNSISITYDNHITSCLNCKNQLQEERLNLLEKIITYNFLNIPPEDKEMYFNLLQFDGTPEEFIQALEEGKELNQPAK